MDPRRSAVNMFGRVFLISILFLISCAPKTEPDLSFIPENYINAKQNSLANKPLAEWWKDFKDPKLNYSIDQALLSNLRFRKALSVFAQAQARVDMASSSLFPEINFNARAERSRLDRRTFGNTSSNFTLSLPVSYEIDLWGRVRKAYEGFEKDFYASAFDVETARIGLIAEVVDSYFLMLTRCKQLELLDQTLGSDEQILALTKKRYALGIANALELYQSRESLATRKTLRPQFESQVREIKNKLKLLEAKYPDGGNFCEVRNLPELPELKSGLPASLLINRPDLQASLLRLEAQDARVVEAIRERLPNIVLSASGGRANTEIDNVLDPDARIWRIAGDLGLPLIDFGKRRANVDLQKAIAEQKEYEFLETLLTAFKEVEEALYLREKLAEEESLVLEQLDAARASQQLALRQYLRGVSDYLNLLLSKSRLYEAERSLLEVRRKRLANHVQLARALGGNWSEL